MNKLILLFSLLALSNGCGKQAHKKQIEVHSKQNSTPSLDGEPLVDLSEAAVPFNNRRALHSSPRQEDTPATLNLSTKDLPSGWVEVSAEGAPKIFVTVDGTEPKAKGEEPLGTAFEYTGPITLQHITIVRAIGLVAGKVTPMRSINVVPQHFEAHLYRLPEDSRTVEGVYLTGAFRNWDQSLTDDYKLSRNDDGSYSRDFNIPVSGETDYKYMVHYTDGGVTWTTDGSSAEVQRGDYVNNVIPDPHHILNSLVLSKNDGQIDETGITVDSNIVAALDAGENIVRMQLSLFSGDVESVVLRFDNGTSVNLAKSTFQSGQLKKDNFSALVRLPAASQHTKFVYVANDHGNSIVIGKNGIAASYAGDAQSPIDSAAGFDFNFDAKTKTINGQDIYQIPVWAVDTVWYQIFPERFRDGDTSNDVPAPLPLEWNKASQELSKITQKVTPWTWSWFSFSPEELATERAVLNAYPDMNLNLSALQTRIVRNRRYGGDLQGVRDSIPYLKSLGVTGVYFNPLFQSDSEHKYDTQDYRHIDNRFGAMTVNERGEKDLFPADKTLLENEKIEDPSTWGYTTADKEFMRLVTELQNAGIRVIIDGVFNHSATNGPLVKDVAKRGKASPFYEWFETAYEGDSDFNQKHCSLSTFFSDARLYPFASKVRFDAWDPECTLINHREGYEGTSLHPKFKDYIFSLMDRWFTPKTVDGIQYKGIDGIRLDVYHDVSPVFWKLFRKKVKSIKSDALIVAEDWYDGYETLQGDQADSLMNYTVRTLAESWFINVYEREKFRPSQMKAFIDERMNTHREHTKYGLMSILSSHDTDRMLSRTLLSNRSLTLRPQDGNAWDYEINNKPDKGSKYSNDKPGALERAFEKAIVGFQMSYVGAPNVYYGDEVGMWGADDPTDRKPMIWDDIAQGNQYETQCLSQTGLWCAERADVRFTVEQDKSMLEAFKRMIKARATHPALRRGKMNTALQFKVGGRTLTVGSAELDSYFIWGYERSYAGQDFAYFVSNQNLALERQNFTVMTKFPAGAKVTDSITGKTFTVDSNGGINLTLERDRAALLTL